MGWPVQSSLLRRNADGTFSRVPGTATSLFVKAVMIYDHDTEVMILNFLYNGEGDLFGCLGPLPSKSRSKPIDLSLHRELDARTGLASFESFRTSDTTTYFKARYQDICNLELLRSMDQIRDWKRRNGFRDLTKKENEVFEYYLSKDMIFFASLVPYGYPFKGRPVNVWTQPVQVTFKSNRIWFPMKSTTTGDGTHSFLSLDILTPSGFEIDPPANFDLKFEGEFELGRRAYKLTRIEAKLTMADMEKDFEERVRACQPCQAMWP